MQTSIRILFLIVVYIIYFIVVHHQPIAITQSGKNYVSVTIIRVDSEDVISEGEIRRVYDDLNHRLKSINVEFQIEKIIKEKDPCPDLNSSSLIFRKFESLYSYSKDRNLLRPNSMIHWIIPAPIDYHFDPYLYGLSSRICSLNKLNMSVSTGVPDKKTGSALIIEHESAHFIGANHLNTVKNIMNQSALSYSEESLDFTDFSLNEMKKCVESVGSHK